MSDVQTFMLRAHFDQPSLMRLAINTGLPPRITDGGYMLHAVLRALFGDAAPRPFVARDDRARRLTLLGYAAADHRELADRARALADPLAVSAIDLESICSKPMPTAWRSGAVYRFEARVCPVVRISGPAMAKSPAKSTPSSINAGARGPRPWSIAKMSTANGWRPNLAAAARHVCPRPGSSVFSASA